jgi:hypothetical protein
MIDLRDVADGSRSRLIGAPLLLATYRRFPFTTLLYVLIALHALVLMLGGAYTYARVPLGFCSRGSSSSSATRTTGSAISCRDSCPR